MFKVGKIARIAVRWNSIDVFEVASIMVRLVALS